LTGVFICGIPTEIPNALGIWIGHEKLVDEFKVEGQLHMPPCGDSKIYSMLNDGSGIKTEINIEPNMLKTADENLKHQL